ncbi:phage major capsid protein [Sphingomonas sp. T9W2]|uniref:phage major capsid protein n=1 Tax=Sphingomonas sp. T9W2 TaxID=3143183 RepID=UPI0031F54282
MRTTILMASAVALGRVALLGPMTGAERAKGRYMRSPDGHNGRSVSEIATELKTHFDNKLNEVKGIAENALGKAERGEPLTGTAKELADQALSGLTEIKTRMDDFEQKMARTGGDEEQDRSVGAQFVESEEFKALGGNMAQGRTVTVEMKTITSLSTNADGSAGALVRAERVPGMLTNLQNRQLRVRDLIAPGTTSSSSIEYPQETGFTNAAGMTAEGALKPESSLKYGLKQAPVRKIAHWMRASSEILADAPALQSMIDERLRYGLAFKEDGQLLNGDGVGQNILGINAVASPYAKPTGAVVAGETPVDRLRLGMLQVSLAEYLSTGFVLNPIDWTNIELVKDAAGGYILANPAGLTGPTLWGQPVVQTQTQAVGKFTTGAWRMAAQIFDRMLAAVTVSSEDRDNFIANLVTILAEERLALAIYRPEAFVYGNVNP